MIQMPVRVEDRRHRPLMRTRERQDAVAVPNVAAGIDDDQPVRRLENQGVPVRPAIGKDGAGDHMHAWRDLHWRGRNLHGRHLQRRRHNQSKDHFGAPRMRKLHPSCCQLPRANADHVRQGAAPA
jgi:hypothetical protein